MTSISINYLRPGKGLTIYEEEHLYDDENCLRTFKTLSNDASNRLSAALHEQGLIGAGQQVLTITKAYFYHEPFNILEFRDMDGNLIGYYSDIGEPVRKLRDGDWEMIDLFLDIWLLPDGRLIELDWDEFEQAIQDNVITEYQATLARNAMQRLKKEVELKIYPGKYLGVL